MDRQKPARSSLAVLAIAISFGPLASGLARADDSRTLAARCASLAKEFDDRFEAAREAHERARTDAERAAVVWPDERDYAPRFLALARVDAADAGACDALCWIIERNIDVHRHKDGVAIGLEAADLLIRHHLDSERLGRACLQAMYGGDVPSPARDRLLRAVLEKSRNNANRGRACLALAQYLKAKGNYLEQLRLPGGDDLAGLMEQWVGREYLASVRADDPFALLDEAEGLYGRVIKEFGDLDYVFEHRHPERLRTLRQIAEPELYEVKNLAIGRVAPEIAGEGVDGKPMKLSDYHGKVTVISFWGSWCGACMAMVPHERDLAARLEGRPFAILGVNSDEDRAVARRTMARERMRWRSWWDGKVGGPIARNWNIRLWPTFFVLDTRGIIRAHGVFGADQIAKIVDALLAEVEPAGPRRTGSR